MKEYECAASLVFTRETWASAASCGPNGGNCVEVNLATVGVVGVRDSKRPNGPVLVFAGEEWSAFIDAARFGRFDRR
jgi:hypothetical protein